MKTLAKKYLKYVLGVAALAYLYAYRPGGEGWFLPCPFHALTGWQCPGCGAQRATHHLLHLEFAKAFGLNALFTLTIPFVLLGFYVQDFKPKGAFWLRYKKLFANNTTVYILAAIALLFTIIRNTIHTL